MLKTTSIFLAVTLGLSAQTIGQREVNQQARINQGVKNGTLTAPEAARLNANQSRIRRQVRRDRADGNGLSRGERKQLRHEQNRQSRRIARQKSDGQTRP
ncbi:MAG: hypothetical protein K2X03_25100 [Bryobacteraceae bacterium]|nr:hypothetical protein [Bryobacteraceae bacterium]